MTFHLDATLRDRWRAEGEGHVLDLPEGWMQGRSVFGGLTAAAAVSLGARQVDPSRRLRALSIQLMSPIEAGAVQGRARVLREGRTTTFVEARLGQNGQQGATAQMVFTAGRDGSIEIPAPAVERDIDPETLDDFRPVGAPEFVQKVEMRWSRGGPPFSGEAEARFEGYCRFRGPAGDAEGIVALLDLWPCPTLSVLTTPVFASTVMWTAHVVCVPESFEGWFFFEYETVAGANGFHTVVGRLYAPDGSLAGWTEQLAVIFD